MTSVSTTWSYEYDANGMRTKRTNGTKTYEYYYTGGQLTVLKRSGQSSIWFYYDASGTPYALYYNGVYYYYMTNAQGDVVAIVDSNGNPKVYYQYDAWGNELYCTGSLASTLGTQNPLRYRGYVYDEETGLYYLQSRYYNPQMGRFLNADALVSTGQGILGNNMFTYCLNKPVNFFDSDGRNAEAVQWWTGAMWWLPFADTALPVGDLIYLGGIIILGALAVYAEEKTVPEVAYTESNVEYGTPSPNHSQNNNEDNEDNGDDSYDQYHENNYGGRQRIGKSNGNAPRNNRVQNKQFKFLTKYLTKEQQRRLHNMISGKGLSAEEILELIDTLFAFALFYFISDNTENGL